MAVKSVIEIDLDDAKFKAFSQLFNQHRKAVASLPAAWKLVNEKIDGSKKTYDKILATMVAQNVQAQLRAKIQEHADRLTTSTADRWKGLARDARSFAGSIQQTTLNILRWGSLTGIVGGLLGAGGLLGIDRLALAASAGRRSSLGLGLGYGQQQAFNANFARLVDPQSFLSSVAGAKFDITKRVGLLGAGLSQQEISGDTGQTAVALLKHLKQIADTTDPSLYAQTIESRRLPTTAEDLNRLRATSPQEFNQLVSRYGQDSRGLDLPSDLTRRWQDFTTQLDRAGRGIETTLIRGLVDLSDPLSHLSESVQKAIKALLQSPALGDFIKKFGDGIEKVAGYIGTPEFQDDVKNFAEGLGKAARAIGAFVTWVTSKVDTASNVASGVGTVGGLVGDLVTGNIDLMGHKGAKPGGPTSSENLLKIIRKLEGSGDTAVSPKGAIGRYQITRDTAETYGADPDRLKDPAYNEQVARKIISDLIKRYHGDTDEVLAAYNGGKGRGDRLQRHGDNNLGLLPRETQNYVTSGRNTPGYAPTVVEINDNTGGNVNVSVNGLKN